MTPIGRRFLVVALTALMAATTLTLTVPAAEAQDISLERAKAAGWVGELPNGYLGIRQERPGVSTLVDRVNAQRRQRYRELALTYGVPVAAIERQAGTQLIGRLTAGEYYLEDNQWVRR